MALEYKTEAGQKLTEFCQENALVTANTSSNNTRLYTWISPNGQYQMIILFADKDGEALYRQQKQPRADCGSDHELLIAKFRLKWTKVRKTTRPFRYDLNQILYGYTVEVTNRFKVLDLIECLKNYERRFVTLCKRQRSRPSPRKRKAKCLPEEALQIAEK